MEQKPSVATSPASRNRVISKQGIDLESLEDMMNRRLKTMWMRHTWLCVSFGLLVFGGLVAATIFFTTKPTIMKIAVGPAGSDDVVFAQKFAEKLVAEKAPVRLQVIVKKDAVTTEDIKGKTEYDIAIVRGNAPLSQDWPVVAILRQDIVAIMVPPASARTTKGKHKKHSKIEKIPDLAGTTVGVVHTNDGGPEVLQLILDHYGVPQDKVKVEIIEPADLKQAVADSKIDAVLIAGPQSGKAIADAVTAVSHDDDGPKFVPIDQAEGIGKRYPPYDKADIPAGSFGGVPPQPDDDMTTLQYPLYMVARKNFNSDKIATFAKYLYTDRQQLAFQLPGVIAIESPPTDKDSAVLVHPGANDYLNDNQKSFFDKYGDDIFYGLLIFPIIGSGLAGVAGYFRADKNTRRIRKLHRLLVLVRKARSVTAVDELDKLQDQADEILGETVEDVERGALDELGLASFALAIDQARQAISEQRTVLALNPGAVQPHVAARHAPTAAE